MAVFWKWSRLTPHRWQCIGLCLRIDWLRTDDRVLVCTYVSIDSTQMTGYWFAPTYRLTPHRWQCIGLRLRIDWLRTDDRVLVCAYVSTDSAQMTGYWFAPTYRLTPHRWQGIGLRLRIDWLRTDDRVLVCAYVSTDSAQMTGYWFAPTYRLTPHRWQGIGLRLRARSQSENGSLVGERFGVSCAMILMLNLVGLFSRYSALIMWRPWYPSLRSPKVMQIVSNETSYLPG